MSKSRTAASLKNFKCGVIFSLLIIAMQFINRMVFTRYVSVEYLGLDGLFSNIISILNLADLGIGTAIIYALYKPYAKKDIEEVKSIMFLYKRMYHIIAAVVLVIGMAIMPFLESFINESSRGIPYLKIYFLICVIDTFASYILAYKRSIIIVNQEMWIINVTFFLKNLFTGIFQIIVIVLYQKFAYYLLVKVVFTLGENILINHIANKRFPYLKEKSVLPKKEVIDNIKRNVFAMSLHKIGGVFVFATDNIIISRFVSLSSAGMYSNYAIIVNGIKGIISKFFSSVSGSVGNLIVEHKLKNREHIYTVFRRILFINFILYFTGAVGVYLCANKFVTIWLGEKYLLDETTVFFLAVYIFSSGIRLSVNTFRDADGLFYNDRYKPLLEGTCNILFSIPLAMNFGIKGTLIGTIITNILIAGSIEGYIVYKHLFEKSFWLYIQIIIQYYLVLVMTMIIGKHITMMFVFNKWLDLLVGVLFSFVVVMISIVITYRKTDEYHYLKQMIVSMKNKVLSKIS